MTSKAQKVILFANGDLPKPKYIVDQIGSDDFLVAVDGGLSHLSNLGLTPHLIIGDMDSVDEDQLQHYQNQNVEVKKYPVEKDQNDLELALQKALEMEPETIWIVAALGNRIDQTLANIFLLTREDLADIDIHIIDGVRDVFLIRENAIIIGVKGQRVSLIPINGPVNGIRTEGLKFPLKNETLFPDKTRGISNKIKDTEAKISIEDGLLLCIHDITNPTKRSS